MYQYVSMTVNVLDKFVFITVTVRDNFRSSEFMYVAHVNRVYLIVQYCCFVHKLFFVVSRSQYRNVYGQKFNYVLYII
jgi:hypothetical protein